MTRYTFPRSIYQTIDFKPDNTWDAWHFSQENPAIFAWPIVGWEIRAETLLDPRTGREIDDQPPLTERPRIIVMVDMDNSGVTGDVEEGNQLWKIVPRGTPLPDRAEFEAEWHEWKKQQEHLRSLRRERLQQETA